MKIYEKNGFCDVYPELISGTDQWFFGQVTACAEAYEVPDFKGNYVGTKLYLFNKEGTVFEPFPQEPNVFLESPVYSSDTDSFGLIRYDFNKRTVEAYQYKPNEKPELLIVVSMDDIGDSFNIRIIKEPFWLVQYDVPENSLDILWPIRKTYQLDEKEGLCWIQGDRMVTSRWFEDPEYREEISFRDLETGNLIERKNGFCREMPDGSIWIMTE